MKIKHNVHGWINNEIPSEGEQYLVAHGGKLVDGVLTGHGSHPAIYTEINPLELKSISERGWRDSELLRTDNWPNDRPPGGQAVLGYRVELRSYPQQVDFPNGVRPTL